MVDQLDEFGLVIWPAAERNKQPILEQLLALLQERSGVLLEIAAATGQHAAHFAPALAQFEYYVSDYDPEHLDKLSKRLALQHIPNLKGPLRLDVTEANWPLARADVIYNANMIHIAPWAVSEGLFAGAARLLPSSGLLITYGPYKRDGLHTSASNEAFDASLQARNPAWGVRDIAELQALAKKHELALIETKSMPANNLLLVWQRS